MARSKRGPALFELLSDNRLIRSGTSSSPDFRVVPPDDDADDAVPGITDTIFVPCAKGDAPSRLGRLIPGVELKGEQLHLWLTPIPAAGALFLLGLLLISAFALGHRRGDQAGFARGLAALGLATASGEPDLIENARNQPPATHLVATLMDKNAPSAPQPQGADRARLAATRPREEAPAGLPGGPQHGWVRDLTYIVAQEFGSGREADALRAREFLRSRGIDTEMVKLENGPIQLITLEGYNHKDPAQKRMADEILKKQRAVGAEYFASGGGYKLEGYYKTLKRDRW